VVRSRSRWHKPEGLAAGTVPFILPLRKCDVSR